MESRLERYLNQKECQKKKRRKIMVIIALIIFLSISILIVDGTLVNFLELSDINVFNYDLEGSTHEFEVFGNKYQIKQDIIGNFVNNIKSPINGIKNYISNIIE